jgi:hypothetical protein
VLALGGRLGARSFTRHEAPRAAPAATDEVGELRTASGALVRRPLDGSLIPSHPEEEVALPDATQAALPMIYEVTPKPTLAKAFAAQAEEICACPDQACVDAALAQAGQALSDAVPSAADDEAVRAYASRVAACRQEQEKKWGLPSSDNHPIALTTSDDSAPQEESP